MKLEKQEEVGKFVEELKEIIDLAKCWNISDNVISNEIKSVLKCNCDSGTCTAKLLSSLELENSLSGNATGLDIEKPNTDSQFKWKSSFLKIVSVHKLLWGCFVSVFKLLFTALILYFIISCHNPMQKFVMRHSQTLIYPVMRSVRLLTLPMIKRYSSLTEWHEEECLVKNPLYSEPPLDCWPCEDVRTLVDLTGLYNYSKAYCYNERPFLVRDFMTEVVTFDALKDIYKSNQEAILRGTAKFSSNIGHVENIDSLLNASLSEADSSRLHVSWKLNRVSAARVLRQVFHRPYFVPNNSEVALQRFIFIDGPEASPYFLPYTDFANVWLAQGHGYRVIVLEPSHPCKLNCTTVSILLRPLDVLYYNWQYWKIRSLPARLSEDFSITYMGSFY